MNVTSTHNRNIKIALVASEQEKINAFLRIVGQPQIEICSFRSLKQLSAEKDLIPALSGLVLDMETTLLASTSEKDFIRSLRRGITYPVLETGLPVHTGVKELPMELSNRIDTFIKDAQVFAAKTNKRIHPRLSRIVRVRILSSLDTGASVAKAITADVSEGGCFIVSFGDWSNVKDIRLEFNDSGIIIPAQIAWKRTWEQSADKFPGFGAQFINLDENSRREINRLLAP